MRVIKKISKKTYKGKNGKEYHYVNYYLELENGLRIGIRTFDVKDLPKLEAVAVSEPIYS